MLVRVTRIGSFRFVALHSVSIHLRSTGVSTAYALPSHVAAAVCPLAVDRGEAGGWCADGRVPYSLLEPWARLFYGQRSTLPPARFDPVSWNRTQRWVTSAATRFTCADLWRRDDDLNGVAPVRSPLSSGVVMSTRIRTCHLKASRTPGSTSTTNYAIRRGRMVLYLYSTLEE